MRREVFVVGGGTAGLTAAIAATERGARVTMFEKMDRAGRKLSITGNGRCNITTTDDPADAIDAFGANGKFLRSAFSVFFRDELIRWMADLGIPIVREANGYYPRSGRASDVTRALTERLTKLGALLHVESPIDRIVVKNGCVTGLRAIGQTIQTSRIILATGGASYPGTGSTGDGYRMAAAAGHTIVPPLPASVPITLRGDFHRELASLSFEGVVMKLFVDGTCLREATGDILFTPWGITGPAALALSKYVAAIRSRKLLTLNVNFKPRYTKEDLDGKFRSDFESGGRRTAANVLSGMLPKRAADAIVTRAGIPLDRKACQVTTAERTRLVGLLTACKFNVDGTRPISEAMVTAGGVVLSEVNPKTMESKIVRGLYICGELLDLDAPTGGYNLQAAFSTGFVAGCAAAEK